MGCVGEIEQNIVIVKNDFKEYFERVERHFILSMLEVRGFKFHFMLVV